MLFTSAALAILAHSASVLAAPAAANYSNTSTTSAPPAPTSTGLSLTQQLFLAETAVDRFALLPKDSQFVFDFNQPQANPGKGGQLITANRKTFPALLGTGGGMAVGRVNPCGMNTLHVHPRGTELQIVTQGRLITAMTPENGVNNANGTRRVIQNEVKAYQMTPFYQGSVHTQFNPDCTPVIFVSGFTTEDFGAGQVADEVAAFRDDSIAATLGQAVDGADIDKIRPLIPASIAEGVEQCLKTCNIAKRS